jgi:NitT/TauT family transport system permease protein
VTTPRAKRDAAIQIALLVGLLGAWEAGSRVGLIDPFYAPPPTRIWAALVMLFSTGDIWSHMAATFSEALMGLIFGTLIGSALAVLAVAVRPAALMLQPVMAALNAIPRIVLAPLLVIWFGIGVASKVALSVMLVMVLIFFAVFTAIAQVDRKLIDRVRTLGGDRRLLLQEVYLPSVAATMLASLRVAVGFAFTGAIVGEFIASSRGLGYLLSFAQSSFNAALTLALVGLIMVFVMVLLGIAGQMERHLLRWR